MAYYGSGYGQNNQNNLQFFGSQYENAGFGGSMANQGPSQAQGGSMAGSSFIDTSQKLSTGILAAFGTSGYPGEPSLLEEIGINFGHIKQKTMAVLNPLGAIDQHIMDDSDLAGPLLFCLLFATFLLLSGKVHFGYIYGVALVGTVAQYAILNLMAERSIDFSRTASVLGYCLLPLVVTSLLGIFVSLDNLLGYIMATLSICWCTYSSSAMFVSYLQLTEMRALVAYPLTLFYCVFSVFSIFAEAR